MEHPILSNCETRLVRLTLDFIYPPLPEGWTPFVPNPPYLNPYLWVVCFEFGGIKNSHLRIEDNIGKFIRAEGQEKHVSIHPPIAWVSDERFGNNNLGSTAMSDYPSVGIDEYVTSKNLESIVTDSGSHVFWYNFDDLVPIPVKMIGSSGSEITFDFNVPGIIGCIAVLMNKKDIPNNAILEGARAMVEALDDGLNQLITDYEFNFIEYLDDLITGEETELIPEESITALQRNVEDKIEQAIEEQVREDADWWEQILWWLGWYHEDIKLGTAFWTWATEDLQGGDVQETQRWTKYKQTFQKEWDLALSMWSKDEYGSDQAAWGTAKFKLIGELSAQKIKCFIATAAYGSTMYSRLNVLRNWRDKILVKRKLGQTLINLYYASSPLLARIIARSQVLRKIVRGILTPITYLIQRRHPSWNELK